MPKNAPEQSAKINTDQDRHPNFAATLRAILARPDLPEGPIERLEVFCHASGEATYRVWQPRAEDSEGGYLSQDDLK
jgi:hypothetical protein